MNLTCKRCGIVADVDLSGFQCAHCASTPKSFPDMKTPTNLLVSILLPTRKRPAELVRCVKSIVGSASGKNEFEIIVRIHRDDHLSIPLIAEWLAMANVKIVIGYNHRGYADLSRFYDDAAGVANGKFIWVMNDDVVVSGTPWDVALVNAPEGHLLMPEIHRLGKSEYKGDMDTPFMMMPNKCWEKYGIRKFDTPFDAGLWQLLRKNGWPTYFLPGVIVHHDREDDATLQPKRKLDEVKINEDYMENL